MKKTSLSVKLPLLFIISTLIIMLVVVIAVHARFQERMIGEYTRMAEGVTQLMADRIDGDRIDEYMEQNFSSEEYCSIIDYLYRLKANYPDVLYLYAYRCEEDGGHMIFDIDAEEVENGEAYEVGYVYELEEPFASQKEKIMAGKEIEGGAVQSEEDGYLFSYCRPVFKSDGSYACSVCVDFSLDHLSQEDNAFTLRLMLMIVGITVLVLAAEVYAVRKWVTDPINDLSHCAGKFAYETEEDRKNNIELLDAVRITSQDEIGVVYQMLRSVTNDSFQSTSSLSQARLDIRDKEEKISEISQEAYRDKLTHVGSLAKFRKDSENLDEGFALVMFDINDLKYVNDHFGHENGNHYIRGCCAIICEHLSEIKARFETESAREDVEPWKRYSASVGMAVNREGEGVDETLKRADEEMYQDKKSFHAKA